MNTNDEIKELELKCSMLNKYFTPGEEWNSNYDIYMPKTWQNHKTDIYNLKKSNEILKAIGNPIKIKEVEKKYKGQTDILFSLIDEDVRIYKFKQYLESIADCKGKNIFNGIILNYDVIKIAINFFEISVIAKGLIKVLSSKDRIVSLECIKKIWNDFPELSQYIIVYSIGKKAIVDIIVKLPNWEKFWNNIDEEKRINVVKKYLDSNKSENLFDGIIITNDIIQIITDKYNNEKIVYNFFDKIKRRKINISKIKYFWSKINSNVKDNTKYKIMQCNFNEEWIFDIFTDKEDWNVFVKNIWKLSNEQIEVLLLGNWKRWYDYDEMCEVVDSFYIYPEDETEISISLKNEIKIKIWQTLSEEVQIQLIENIIIKATCSGQITLIFFIWNKTADNIKEQKIIDIIKRISKLNIDEYECKESAIGTIWLNTSKKIQNKLNNDFIKIIKRSGLCEDIIN